MFARLHPERRGIVEGLRFGVLIGVVLVGFAAVWNYVTLPISPAAGHAAAVEYVAPSLLYGAIIGAVERGRAIR